VAFARGRRGGAGTALRDAREDTTASGVGLVIRDGLVLLLRGSSYFAAKAYGGVIAKRGCRRVEGGDDETL